MQVLQVTGSWLTTVFQVDLRGLEYSAQELHVVARETPDRVGGLLDFIVLRVFQEKNCIGPVPD